MISGALLSRDMMSMRKAEVADRVVVVLGVVVVEETGELDGAGILDRLEWQRKG